jgi:hypothetical protein
MYFRGLYQGLRFRWSLTPGYCHFGPPGLFISDRYAQKKNTPFVSAFKPLKSSEEPIKGVDRSPWAGRRVVHFGPEGGGDGRGFARAAGSAKFLAM